MQTKTAAQVAPLHDQIDTPTSFACFYKPTSQSVRNWVNDGRIPVIFRTEKVIRFWRGEAIAALNAWKGGNK
jgi:hypothetical protein